MKNSFLQRRPIIFAVLLYLVILVALFLAGAVTIRLKLPSLAIFLIGYPVLALPAILLVSRWHWWREAGFRLPSNPRSLWFFAVALLPAIANLAFAGVGYPGIGLLLLFLALALLVGFVEETYFRGMMLRALLRRGPWQAVLITSLLFSIGHPFNLLAGASLAATLVQVVYAFAMGMMFAALMGRTQTILPLIVAHGLTNFFGYLAVSPTETISMSTLFLVVSAAEIIIYIAYSILLMRQVKSRALGTEMETPSIPTPTHV
jgi:membrane protease YdiL (CAAX protease family)